MRRWLGTICVAVVCFGALIATSPMLPMAWDEGNAINRAAGVREWCGEVRRHGASALGEAAIARHWHYVVEIEGHPALYGVVIAAGQWLAGDWLAPLTAARLGPMLLFSLAAGAMFYRLRRQYSLVAAFGGAAALLAMPRLFAHAHFASFDGPLTSCWILAWAMFPMTFSRRIDASGTLTLRDAAAGPPGGSAGGTPPRAFPTDRATFPKNGARAPRWRVALVWPILWGVALGATMSCKFTGWLAPLPFIAYAVVYGDRRTAKTVAIGLATALATFWLANPRLWHQPLGGMATFFDLNLNRAGTHLDIPTMFFGRRYGMQSPLPWHNTLAWTAITVPPGVLVLGAIGVANVLRRWAVESHGMLIFGNWLILLVARALPGTPVHDAERLILPSFAFLAALAGIGTARVLEWAGFGRNAPRSGRRRLPVAAFVTLAYLCAAFSLIWHAPQWLSYYSPVIGGLRGADAAGMEATYYWDALDAEVLDWLHAHTGEGDKIEFSAGPPDNLALMQKWGVLRRGTRSEEAGEYRWYVVQRRPTFWQPRDRWLVEHEQPAFAKTIRPPSWGIGPWRLDVPLILIYSAEQRDRAVATAPLFRARALVPRATPSATRPGQRQHAHCRCEQDDFVPAE